MILEKKIRELRPIIEQSMMTAFDQWLPKEYEGLRHILSYHMGWEGEDAGEASQGKRIRPLLVLLCCSAAGEDWQHALSAAAAVEFIHNFSLLHDDIQDRSETRRGRLTAWVKWGDAMAINAGDSLFTVAFLTLSGIKEFTSSESALLANQLLLQACVKLTQGQHLDLMYEKIESLPYDAYWPMIEGKTAALLGCATELGALSAKASQERCESFYQFGVKLGLAFQVVDDWLGIWGDPHLTGKPAGSDLVSGKKTIPVLYGLHQKGRFYQRWLESPIQPDETAVLSEWLVEEGAQAYTQDLAERLTNEAITSLDDAAVERNDYYLALKELSLKLTNRRN